ncbi:uncharacterized protein [Ptychodera flava]|uniref:uncharacterized protein n=1 Tax=Ptychodera flava TaxID=63121 RepID=UPI00396A48EB
MGRRKWWLEAETGSKVHLYSIENGKKCRMRNKKTGVEFGEVISMSVFKDKPDALKFDFLQSSGQNFVFVLERKYFEWNRSTFSRKFKEASTPGEMVAVFTDWRAQFNGSQRSTDSDDEDEEDQDDGEIISDTSSPNCSDRSASSPGSPPADPSGGPPALGRMIRPKKRKLTSATDSVSAVTLKRQYVEEPKSDVQTRVQQAFCGHFTISVRTLECGNQQIRKRDDQFLKQLVKSMEDYRDEAYQPLCLSVRDLLDTSQFDGTKVNGYAYDVIGGQHTLLATRELAKRHQGDNRFKTLNCVVYAGLQDEDKKWLGVRHNKTGEFRHAMTFRDKVAICRASRSEMPVDIQPNEFKNSCRIILNEEKINQTVDIACMLASYDDATYSLIIQFLEMFEDGCLKDQKLKSADRISRPDFKPYKFKQFKVLDAQTIQALLQDAIDHNISLEQFTQESTILSKLRRVQRAFIHETGVRDWEEAVKTYPHETTRERLLRFTNLKFKALHIPETFVQYCQRVKRENSEGFNHRPADVYSGNGANRGFIFRADVLKLNPTVIKENGVTCDGFDLVVVDVPNDWSTDDIRELVVVIKNLNTNTSSYRVILLCEVDSLMKFKQELKATDCFKRVEDGFYYVENTKKETKVTLTRAVKSVIVAYASTSAQISADQVSCAGRHNFWSVKQEVLEKDGEGDVICTRQKPLQLYEHLIKEFTPPGSWMLDGSVVQALL